MSQYCLLVVLVDSYVFRSLDDESIESNNVLKIPEMEMSKLLADSLRLKQKMASARRSPKGRRKVVPDDTVFMTGVVMEEAEDAFEDGFDTAAKPIDQLSELDKTYQQIEALKNTVSSLDVLKVKHKYGNIYTNT